MNNENVEATEKLMNCEIEYEMQTNYIKQEKSTLITNLPFYFTIKLLICIFKTQ